MSAPAVLGRSPAASVPLLLGVLAYAAAVGYLTVESRPLAALAVIVALVVAVTARNAAWLAVAAMVGVWMTSRAPGLNVSFTDLLVTGAGAAAWAGGVGRTLRPEGRIILKSFALYLGLLSVTLAYNHSLRSDFEWFHRVGLVVGGIFVGAWLVHAGLHHLALRGVLSVTVVMSAAAVVDVISTGLEPAEPFGYHKNFVGSIAATMLLVVLAAHREFRLPGRWLQLAGVVMAAGLLASQSRGAMTAFAIGALIFWYRRLSRMTPRLRRIALLGAVALACVAVFSVREQLQTQQTHGSLNQRFEVERTTRQLWLDHPLTGVGLRFFKTSAYVGYQAPNNVLNETLAEAGVLGLVGLVVFAIGSLVGLARIPGDLAAAAFCVVAARLVHGMFDIYWTGGTTTLPWIVAGMALAMTPVWSGAGRRVSSPD